MKMSGARDVAAAVGGVAGGVQVAAIGHDFGECGWHYGATMQLARPTAPGRDWV